MSQLLARASAARRGVLLALAALALAGCTNTAPTTNLAPSSPAVVAIPTGNLSPYDRCMLAAGWEISGVLAGYPGDPPGHSWVYRGSSKDGLANSAQCSQLLPPIQEKTPAEIRVVYDRWVGERECLIKLGYHPASPPSFEQFLGDWKIGPWMPIDGVDTNSWNSVEYKEAKDKCMLEMFDAS